MNSSPARRATVSVVADERHDAARELAQQRRRRRAWPCVSLMRLNASMSRNRRPTASPGPRARASASPMRRRTGCGSRRPVSASNCARRASSRLHLLERRDVGRGAVDARPPRRSRRDRERSEPRTQRMPRASRVLHLEVDVLAAKRALDVRPVDCVGLRTEHLEHGATGDLGERTAEPLLVEAAVEAVAPLAVDVADQRRHVLRDAAQALLALLHAHLRVVQVGDVVDQREEAGDLAVGSRSGM